MRRAGFVYRRTSRDVRLWASGPWVLHVYQIGRGWYAELHDLRSPRGTWPVEVLCRSRSRAVDVGRRMLARALSCEARRTSSAGGDFPRGKRHPRIAKAE